MTPEQKSLEGEPRTPERHDLRRPITYPGFNAGAVREEVLWGMAGRGYVTYPSEREIDRLAPDLNRTIMERMGEYSPSPLMCQHMEELLRNLAMEVRRTLTNYGQREPLVRVMRARNTSQPGNPEQETRESKPSTPEYEPTWPITYPGFNAGIVREEVLWGMAGRRNVVYPGEQEIDRLAPDLNRIIMKLMDEYSPGPLICRHMDRYLRKLAIDVRSALPNDGQREALAGVMRARNTPQPGMEALISLVADIMGWDNHCPRPRRRDPRKRTTTTPGGMIVTELSKDPKNPNTHQVKCLIQNNQAFVLYEPPGPRSDGGWRVLHARTGRSSQPLPDLATAVDEAEKIIRTDLDALDRRREQKRCEREDLRQLGEQTNREVDQLFR